MTPFAAPSASLLRFIQSRLRRALPPCAEDDPATQDVQDRAALLSVMRLDPANTAEAEYAVHAVAARAHATECLAAVGEHQGDFDRQAQCRAQSALMLRQASLALRELRALQAERHAAEGVRAMEEAAEAASAPEPAAPQPETPIAPPPRPTRAWPPAFGDRRAHVMRLIHAERDSETRPGIPGPATVRAIFR